MLAHLVLLIFSTLLGGKKKPKYNTTEDLRKLAAKGRLIREQKEKEMIKR